MQLLEIEMMLKLMNISVLRKVKSNGSYGSNEENISCPGIGKPRGPRGLITPNF